MEPPPKRTVCVEIPGSKKILEFLQREFPHLKIRRKIRPGTTAEQAYREDVEAFLERAVLRGFLEGPDSLKVFPVKHGEVVEVKALLSTLVPDVTYDLDGDSILAIGSVGALDQVGELIVELDRPLNSIMLDIKLVDLTEEGARNLGVTWVTHSSQESQQELVNGVPIQKTPTPLPTNLKIGSFARTH